MQVWFMEIQISDHSLYHSNFSPAIPKLRTRGDLPPGPERFLKQHSEKNDNISSLFKTQHAYRQPVSTEQRTAHT